MARRDSKLLLIPRGGAVAARRAHNPKVLVQIQPPLPKQQKGLLSFLEALFCIVFYQTGF